MNSTKLMMAAAGLTFSSAALAENLVLYEYTRTGSVYYYDTDTVRKVGGYITVWTLQDAKNDRTVKFRTRRTLWKIDCDEMSSAGLAQADYDAMGSALDSKNVRYPSLTPDVPGSVGYSLTQTVCGK
jgi:hypothetical protein